MKYLIILAILLTGCSGGGSDTETAVVIKESAIEQVILFEDNFDGDLSQWNVLNTWRPNKGIAWKWSEDNAYIEDGLLVIKYTNDNGRYGHYEVGAINTQGKFENTYGYYEASIKVVDNGVGLQSCFWMMPDYIDGYDGTGNDGAEIDILESNRENDVYSITLHHDGYGDYHQTVGGKAKAPGMHEGFNTYAMDWTPDYLKFYYNGQLVKTIDDPTKIPHVDEFMILSGSFFVNGWVDGDLNEASLPSYMYVDWVRVTI